MPAHVVPTNLQLVSPETLQIEWSDGQRRRYSVRALRDACPCASCREKRSQPPAASSASLPIIAAHELQPLRLLGMEPVGSYAYSIQFSDGHNTGIYTLELLRELGEACESG